MLDFAEPSTIADAVLWLWSGETTQQVYEAQKSHIAQSTAAAAASLAAKIEKLKKECKLLYG